MTVAPGSDVGTDRRAARRRAASSPTRPSSASTPRSPAAATSSSPGNYTLQRDMTYGAALDALVKGPKAKVVKTLQARRSPRACRAARWRRKVKAASRATTSRRPRSPASCAARARLGAAQGQRRASRASCSRRPTTWSPARPPTTSSTSSSTRSGTTSTRCRLATAKKRNLTRYDVLIIASMVEREAQLDRERPLVAARHLQPPARGDAARHRRDDPLRREQLDEPLKVSELERPGPYNTRLNRGLPPTPIGNPGLASLKAAANPAADGLPLLRRQAGRPAASTRSRAPTRSSARTVARYNAERARPPEASRRPKC